MAATNQEVINETSAKSDEFKLQMESLEQQMRADKRFMEEQAIEREGEREEFTRKIELLQDIIKRKEKEEDAKISLLSKKVSIVPFPSLFLINDSFQPFLTSLFSPQAFCRCARHWLGISVSSLTDI